MYHLINYESLHKVSHETMFDYLILDEAYRCFQENNVVRQFNVSLIYIGQSNTIICTPTPESYHKCFIKCMPYPVIVSTFKNFYQFAKVYVGKAKKD